MLYDNNKTKVLHMYKNSTFIYMYNMKTTILYKFSNLDIYDISKFWLKTEVTIEL